MNNKGIFGLMLVILVLLAFSGLAGAQEGPTYTPPPDSPSEIDLGPPGPGLDIDTPRTAGGPAMWQTALLGVLLLTAALPLMGRKH